MSGGEIILIVLVGLLLFGAKGLPDMARFVGKTLREVKKATDDIKRELNQETGLLTDIREIQGEIRSVGQQMVDKVNREVDRVESPIPANSVSDPYSLHTPSPEGVSTSGPVADTPDLQSDHDSLPKPSPDSKVENKPASMNPPDPGNPPGEYLSNKKKS